MLYSDCDFVYFKNWSVSDMGVTYAEFIVINAFFFAINHKIEKSELIRWTLVAAMMQLQLRIYNNYELEKPDFLWPTRDHIYDFKCLRNFHHLTIYGTFSYIML